MLGINSPCIVTHQLKEETKGEQQQHRNLTRNERSTDKTEKKNQHLSKQVKTKPGKKEL